ncbi:tetratricopeptide repeat protein [Algisphaera agarilytica]|uniref:Tetratricopeptide (TPR) repeat protein n=1 Tax=Algisphaera agarilytica TaxID=1385975 RepID=A0A7X0LK27_9BACT|nr:tetratricopeptide repeat protein [Algisphaera agarilytica]MBB6429389.1 tetratricopeptide (TPR) repeat protein [Algisphaera agarilytica]
MKHFRRYPARLVSPALCLAAAVVLQGVVGCATSTSGVRNSSGGSAASDNRSGSVKVSADQRIRAGQILKDNGQLAAALNEFNRALESNPNSVDAVMGIGSVEHAREQYEKARETYRKAVGMDENRSDARYFLGLMQQVLGEIGEAILEYQRALELNPNDPATHRDLATAYLQVGRPDLSLPHAEKAVELQPGSQPAWCNLAVTYSILGRYDDALTAYRTATEIDELDAPVLLGMGDTHLKLGNFQRAVNTLAELVRQFPSAVAHERFAYALFRVYEFDVSIQHYRRALVYDPNETNALNGLGACLLTDYLQQKNLRRKAKLYEALAAWRSSLRINPNQPQIVDLLTRYDLPD